MGEAPLLARASSGLSPPDARHPGASQHARPAFVLPGFGAVVLGMLLVAVDVFGARALPTWAVLVLGASLVVLVFYAGEVTRDPGLVVRIDPGDAAAPYDQIRRQISTAVSRGDVEPGTKLPTVRALAAELGIAANTVARAYRELEHAGVVETRGRLGTVVSGDGVDRAAKTAARAYADAVRALGLSQDDALDLVRRAFDRPTSS